MIVKLWIKNFLWKVYDFNLYRNIIYPWYFELRMQNNLLFLLWKINTYVIVGGYLSFHPGDFVHIHIDHPGKGLRDSLSES